MERTATHRNSGRVGFNVARNGAGATAANSNRECIALQTAMQCNATQSKCLHPPSDLISLHFISFHFFIFIFICSVQVEFSLLSPLPSPPLSSPPVFSGSVGLSSRAVSPFGAA